MALDISRAPFLDDSKNIDGSTFIVKIIRKRVDGILRYVLESQDYIPEMSEDIGAIDMVCVNKRVLELLKMGDRKTFVAICKEQDRKIGW